MIICAVFMTLFQAHEVQLTVAMVEPFSITDLSVSPRGEILLFADQHSRIIYVPDPKGQAAPMVFELPAPGRGKYWLQQSFSWDKIQGESFLGVFVKTGRGQKEVRVFIGNLKTGKLEQVAGEFANCSDFNYLDQYIYYIDHHNNSIMARPENGNSLVKWRSQSGASIHNLHVASRKRMLFSLHSGSRSASNNSDIYFLETKASAIADNPLVDEKFPLLSDTGKRLAFLEKSRHENRWQVVVREWEGKVLHRSRFSFAGEQNALLKNYRRTWFLGEELYFYTAHLDQYSDAFKPGLFCFGSKGKVTSYSRESLPPILEKWKKPSGFAILGDGSAARCELKIQPVEQISELVPFFFEGRTWVAVVAECNPILKLNSSKYHNPGRQKLLFTLSLQP